MPKGVFKFKSFEEADEWERKDARQAISKCIRGRAEVEITFRCHRSLQNQPIGVASKPATLKAFIYIRLLDAAKAFQSLVMIIRPLQHTNCSLYIQLLDVTP